MSYTNKPKEVKHSQAVLRTELYVTPRIQSLGFTANLNTIKVYELGNPNVVDILSEEPEVSFSLDMLDYGSIDFINQLTTEHIGETGNTNQSSGVIQLSDFFYAATDFNVVIKENKTTDEISRTCWFNYCFLDSISGSYGVGQLATETFEFTGSSQAWFLEDIKETLSIPLNFVSNSQLVANIDAYERLDFSVGLNSELYENGKLLSNKHYNVSSTGTVSAISYSFDSGNRYRLVGPVLSEVDFPTIPEYSEIAAIQEKSLEIVMWDDSATGGTDPLFGSDETDQLLRLQSAEYTISFDREDLQEITTGKYYRPLINYSIEVTLTALASDLQLWFYGIGKVNEWKAGTQGNSVSLEEFSNQKDLKLRIAVFNRPDLSGRDYGNVLKYIQFEEGTVTSLTSSVDSQGRKTSNISIKFQDMFYVGTGLSQSTIVVPQFEILSVYEGFDTIAIDITSQEEYYYEVGWKESDETDWHYSEFSLTKTDTVTHNIDSSYFSPGDTCEIRVRAKDENGNVSPWQYRQHEIGTTELIPVYISSLYYYHTGVDYFVELIIESFYDPLGNGWKYRYRNTGYQFDNGCSTGTGFGTWKAWTTVSSGVSAIFEVQPGYGLEGTYTACQVEVCPNIPGEVEESTDSACDYIYVYPI